MILLIAQSLRPQLCCYCHYYTMERRYGEGHEGQPQPLVVEQPHASYAEAGSFTIYVNKARIFLLLILFFPNMGDGFSVLKMPCLFGISARASKIPINFQLREWY